MSGVVLRPKAFHLAEASPWDIQAMLSSMHHHHSDVLGDGDDAEVLVSQSGFHSSLDASAFAEHTRPPHIPCALDTEAFLEQISNWR